MKTNEFIQQLAAHINKELVFQYQEGELVGANYHITEIKNVTFDTVDCGGTPNYWQETIVQLWESPTELEKRTYLKSEKALAIFKRVNQVKPLLMETEIKFEYGNAQFHTSVMSVASLDVNYQRLLVNLALVDSRCKALDVCCAPTSDTNKESCSGSDCC